MVGGTASTIYDYLLVLDDEVRQHGLSPFAFAFYCVSLEDLICLEGSQDVEFVFLQSV